MNSTERIGAAVRHEIPGHPVLQVDIPTENIIAMYNTAFEYGKY